MHFHAACGGKLMRLFSPKLFLTLVVLPFLVGGCASTQLTYNTVDVASSFTDLYTRQVLSNLSTYIDQPNALPSQTDITAGTVQTSNSVTPSGTTPLSKTLTANGVGVLSSTSLAGSGLTVSASDSWQQNWNILPISDANTLRNLRAIYRYAVYGSNLFSEYHVPRAAKDGNFPEDRYWLRLPQCVICEETVRGRPTRIVNPKLKAAWLFTEAGVPQNVDVVDLGHYGNHELFMTRVDYRAGVLSDFLLFVLPNGEPTDGAKTASAGGPRATAPSNRPNFTPPPTQIIPAPPP